VNKISAALPSYTTLGTNLVRGGLRIKDGIVTLYDALFQEDLYSGHTLRERLEDTIRKAEANRLTK